MVKRLAQSGISSSKHERRLISSSQIPPNGQKAEDRVLQIQKDYDPRKYDSMQQAKDLVKAGRETAQAALLDTIITKHVQHMHDMKVSRVYMDKRLSDLLEKISKHFASEARLQAERINIVTFQARKMDGSMTETVKTLSQEHGSTFENSVERYEEDFLKISSKMKTFKRMVTLLAGVALPAIVVASAYLATEKIKSKGLGSKPVNVEGSDS